MKLSIVVPTRNTRALTLACLESLRNAGADPEVVVVDEASADGTADEVRSRHPEVVVIENASAQGFSAAANVGLRAATGDLLLLLNSDTEVRAGGLAALLLAFAEQADLGIVGAQLYFPDGRPQWSGGRFPGLPWLFGLATGLPAILGRLRRGRGRTPPFAVSAPMPVEWVTGAALAMRRPVWEGCGPLDESFEFYAQDLDFCQRSRAAGWAVRVVPGFAVVHHQGATIGGAPGTLARQNPGLLWRDLVHWAGKSGGAVAARRARRALAAGSAIRLFARNLRGVLIASPDRRAVFAADSAAIAAARRTLVASPISSRAEPPDCRC
jgi:N-acetylglucosaminyl-diphospho-decaprenol L-rhamnosyltransferase